MHCRLQLNSAGAVRILYQSLPVKAPASSPPAPAPAPIQPHVPTSPRPISLQCGGIIVSPSWSGGRRGRGKMQASQPPARERDGGAGG